MPDPSQLPADPVARARAIMAILRGPEGCPWDREQSLETLRPHLIEEAYEVLDAIASGDADHHAEELGDLLLQILFHCQLREEEGAFSLDDVAQGLADKLIRRHPHVFGDVRADSSAEVLRNWEAIKKEEKARARTSALDGVPRSLPALLRADQVQRKAARVGFDWPDASGPEAKVREEIDELRQAREAGDATRVREEFGDLLFALVNLGRHLGLDAEDCLHAATAKFAARFREVEARAAADGADLRALDLAGLDRYWDAAKADAQNRPSPTGPTPAQG